jgi:intracellular sulfur oxidation DsrE/DsrF family protein
MLEDPKSPVARRSFLTRLGGSLAVLGASLTSGTSPAAAQTAEAGGWKPARHTEDDWLDRIPGKHRFVFDTTSPAGIGTALLYVNNVFLGNESGYGLGNADVAVVIVARHDSTPFAYTDAAWAKYGALLSQRSGFTDPKTQQGPVLNVYNATGYEAMLPSRGTTVDGLVKRGVHFAVCQMATRNLSGIIARATGTNANDVYAELASNLVGNAHLVPAGIVAVNRAQERGYSFASTG